MGDPAGASAQVHSSLKKDGTWMIVEPFAGDKSRTSNPIGRAFYGASTFCVRRFAVAGVVALALGAQRMNAPMCCTRPVLPQATQTPFNLSLKRGRKKKNHATAPL